MAYIPIFFKVASLASELLCKCYSVAISVASVLSSYRFTQWLVTHLTQISMYTELLFFGYKTTCCNLGKRYMVFSFREYKSLNRNYTDFTVYNIDEWWGVFCKAEISFKTSGMLAMFERCLLAAGFGRYGFWPLWPLNIKGRLWPLWPFSIKGHFWPLQS